MPLCAPTLQAATARLLDRVYRGWTRACAAQMIPGPDDETRAEAG